MGEMIDRVARKLCCPGECRAEVANAAHPERLFQTPCNAITKAAEAKAAIEEMMPPTEEMIRAGNRTFSRGGSTVEIFDDMIREALR